MLWLHAGLSPEFVMFPEGKDMSSGVHHYLLRPEAMEAMFVLWHVTQNEKYRDWAWRMFLAFEKHCKVSLSADGVCLTAMTISDSDSTTGWRIRTIKRKTHDREQSQLDQLHCH